MVKPYQILMVIDDMGGDEGYTRQLQQDDAFTYRVLAERQDAQILVACQSPWVDGIVLECSSTDSSPFDLLRQLKRQMGERCPPVVVLGSGEAEVAVQAFKHGATDYLVRERVAPEDLRLTLRSAIENAQLRRELQRSQEQFQTSVETMLDCFGIFSSIRNDAGQIIDFRIDYLNAAACESNQIPPAMQLGRGLCEVLPSHRKSGLFDDYCRLVATGEPLVRESLIYEDHYGGQRLVRAFDIRATKLNDGFVACWRDITQTITQREQAEAAIQQLNQDLMNRVAELQTLLDIIPVGISIASDPACTQMQSNAYIRQLLGVRPGSNISKSASAPEQVNYRVFQGGEEVLAENLPMQAAARLGIDVRDAEIEILLSDGTVRQVLAYATPLQGDARPVRGAIGVFLDITERNQAATALKASQQRYRELAEAMPQMVWTADATGAVNYWNQRWYEYSGLSEAESMGLACASTIHPGDRDRTLEHWGRATQQGEPFEIEYRVRRWDGLYHWFISRGIPTRDSQGQVTGWVGTVTNIDSQKRLEERLRLVLHAVNGLVFDWNFETNAVYRSEKLLDLVGVHPKDAPSSHAWWHERIHPDDRARLEAHWPKRLTHSRDLYETEYRIWHEDGYWVDVWERGCLVRDDQGQVIRIIGSTVDITHRKQAELKHQRSEAVLQAFMAASPIALALFDRELRFIYANEALAQINHLPLQEHFGRTLEETLPQMADQFAPLLRQIMETQEPVVNLEFRGEVQPGIFRSTIANHYPVCLPNGEVMGVGVAVMDVSDLIQAQQELRDSEERFQQLVARLPQVFWMAEPLQHRLIYISPAYESIWGRPRAAIYANYYEWMDAIHPDDRDRVISHFNDMIPSGHYNIEYRIIRPDGGLRWVHDRAMPIQHESGEVQRVAGIAEDITDRKRAEAALQERSDHIQLLYEITRDLLSSPQPLTLIETVFNKLKGFMGLDICLNYMLDDQQTLHLTFYGGLEQEMAQQIEWLDVGQSICGVAAQQQRQVVKANIQHSHDPEAQLARSLGVTAFASQPLMAQGKLFGTLGFGSLSRTQFTASEKSLFQAICDQMAIALERSELLTSLQQQTDELMRVNRIKDEFLAVLSHELRSPLNPILGWTKLLQTHTFDATRTAEALATIERNAKLQVQLIDDLLDVAKILRGKLSLEMAPVNLVTVIEAAIDIMRAAAVAKDILIHPVLPQLGSVSGDAMRLQQVVWNLLSNAIKFTPSHGRVDIHLERVGTHASITVRDTGKGINPNFLPHIFESFRQEDASTTRKFGGLGLGLAIVRQIVEAHGGTITADSLGEGLGATFTVCFPLLKSEPEASKPQARVAAAPDLTGIRVLIVDDELDARKLVAVLLTQYGATVMTAASAVEVFANWVSFQPNLLISDIGMPEIDGYSLIQQIRARPPAEGGAVPAIALTAYAREIDHTQALAAGFQAHLTKPIDPQQLLEAIARTTASQPE